MLAMTEGVGQDQKQDPRGLIIETLFNHQNRGGLP